MPSLDIRASQRRFESSHVATTSANRKNTPRENPCSSGFDPQPFPFLAMESNHSINTFTHEEYMREYAFIWDSHYEFIASCCSESRRKGEYEAYLANQYNFYFEKNGYPELAFASTEKYVNFLHNRPFLFEKLPKDKYYRNTSFAHREGLANIVRFIHERNAIYGEGCHLEDLLKFCRNETRMVDQTFRFEIYDPKENQPWNDTYFFHKNVTIDQAVNDLLEKYELYFLVKKLENDIYVRLKPLVFEIPSLTGYSLRMKTLDQYTDKSRSDVYLARIIEAQRAFAIAEILGGPFAGRRVDLDINMLDLSNVDLEEHTSPSDLVLVHAFIIFERKNHFQGTMAVPVKRETLSEMRNRKIRKRSTIALDEDLDCLSLPDRVLSDEDVAKRATLKKLVYSERVLINFVEEIFARGNFTEDEFVQEVACRRGHNFYFISPGHALQFAQERPHLFRFDPTGRCLKQKERMMCNKLFELLHDAGKAGVTNFELMKALTAGAGGKDLKNLPGRGMLPQFLGPIRQLLSIVRYDNPVDLVFGLKVHFDKTEKILIPCYPNTAPETDADSLLYRVLSKSSVAERPTLSKHICSERVLIKFVEEILACGNFTEAQFLRVVSSRRGNLDCFKSPVQALEFAKERPHLFRFDPNGRCLERKERMMYSRLFEFLHDVGRGGVTHLELIQALAAGAGGEDLKNLALSGTYDYFLEPIMPLLSVARYVNPMRLVFGLKVYFDKTEKILLPCYPNTVPHLPVS